MRIRIASPRGNFTYALQVMLIGLAPDSEIEIMEDLATLLAAPSGPQSNSPDILLLDLDHASVDAGKVVSDLHERYPAARILALASREDDAYIKDIFEAGAVGYLPKSHSETIIRGVLTLILGGGTYRPYVIAAEPAKANGVPRSPAQPLPAPGALHEFGLTDRQIEVLSLAAQGKPNLAIAKQLGIAEGTVKLHMSAIFKALGVQNRSEAVLLASRLPSVNFRQIKIGEGGALDVDWLLPHMSHQHLPRDTVLFRKGDAGAELCYLQRGTIRLEEFALDLNSGSVFGEIGLFSPSHERTCTAVCTTDVDLFTLTSDQVKRLYLLNPQFALFVVHLIARRLMADRSRVI
ncbi:MAG: LuxR C-terminal-related transcriptional regulator [Betaproteobacteria bacterium]